MKILAAIVTYNRLDLLKRCIQHIDQQTRKVDDLIVINNSSSDCFDIFVPLVFLIFVTIESVKTIYRKIPQ